MVGLSDDNTEFSVTPVIDNDGTANTVVENVANGTVVGITALASDADATDSVTYSLTDDAGGRFTIDTNTGVVTVADGSLLDYEAATSHTVTVQALSTDGSTSSQNFTVNLSNENELPTLATTDSTGNEDTAIALDIQLSDLDAVATTTVTVTGVPAGATLSAGTDNGGGSWTLTPAQVSGLTITPPNDSDVDFQLSVTANSDDGSTSLTTTPMTIDVTVDPVADTPTLTVTNTASGNEDGSVPITFSPGILALDGTPSFSVTVSGVPAGATLNMGTDNGDGSWTLGSGELTGVYVTPPTGDDTDFQLSISATGTSTATLIDTGFDTDASGFTYQDDAFRGTSEAAYADGAWGAGEGETGGGLRVDVGGIDNADIFGMSGGFQTTFNVAAGATGTLSFRYNMTQAPDYENDESSQVLVNVDGTLYGAGGNDYVAQITGDGNGGAAQTTGWQTFTVDLGSLTPGVHTLAIGGYNDKKTFNNESTEIHIDDVQLTTSGATTVAETFDVSPDFINLNIAASLNDIDGSETLSILIDNMPAGATLSAGTDNGDGSWTLTQGQLSGLKLFPAGDYSGTFQLSVTATSTDGTDTAIINDTIDVTVDAVADAPQLTLTDADSETQVFASSFETAGPGNSGFVAGPVDGWSVPAGNAIEYWHESQFTGDATDGDYFIELDDQSGGTFADAGTIMNTVTTVTDTPYELSFDVSPRPGFESYMDFQVSAIDVGTGTVLKTLTIDWNGTPVTALTWQQQTLSFVGTGGDVQLVFQDIGTLHASGRGAFIDNIQFKQSDGFNGAQAIALSGLIAVSLTDTDGSETLGDIGLSNIPAGSIVMSGGVGISVVDGVAQVTPAQLGSLTIQPPAGFTGELNLEVTATTTETSTGGTSSVTDTLTIGVVSNDEDLDSLGTAGNNTLTGDAGDNTLYGGTGNDTLTGNAGEDVLYGGSGNDTIDGGDDNDSLFGGAGDDTIDGGDGADFIFGGTGDDALTGGAGNDALHGGLGDDVLAGGLGDDVLDGGEGNDTATGGDGNDIFIFASGDGTDTFNAGGGAWTDTVDLDGVEGQPAYSGWSLNGATVVDTGDDYLVLAVDSNGTITFDDGSELTFTGVDRIEW